MVVEGKYVGYCSELPFKRGDRVQIKKGTALRSTHPDPAKKRCAAGRTYTITVFDVSPGVSEPAWAFGHDTDKHIHNPTVIWHGTGGYWFEADINDVEAVS